MTNFWGCLLLGIVGWLVYAVWQLGARQKEMLGLLRGDITWRKKLSKQLARLKKEGPSDA